MWQSILLALKDIGDQWTKLSVGRKAGVFSLAGIVVACFLALGVWVGEKSYAPLYTDLQPESSIALVKILQEEKIPYLVSNDGTTISIPPELVQPTLMKLAIRGTPGGQKPGLELFDKESFGTSSYVQRINYVRAIQGELTRTINTLKPVKRSTVAISIPPKSSFLEETEEPKASVVVELQPGSVLAREEIRGIQNLISSSVEGLKPDRVAIVDSSGVALTRASDPLSAMTSAMLEKQKTVEAGLERRVEDIVSRIAGQGNVVVRVNAELDFDPVREQETMYDPDQTALKSQNKQENNMESTRPIAQGVAGAQGALPSPASAGESAAKQNVAKTNDKTDFEVSSRIRHHEKAVGSVKRLTVAVLVNEHRAPAAADAKEGDPVKSVGLTDEQKAMIAKLTKDAVGFVDGRDSVSIESAAFATEDVTKADTILRDQERRHLTFSLVRYGAVALFIMLFFGMVVRPFVRWLTGLSSAKVETILPKTVEELELIQDQTTQALPGLANLPLLEESVDIEKAEGELLKEKINSLINQNPMKAAQVLADWMVVAEGTQKKGRK